MIIIILYTFVSLNIQAVCASQKGLEDAIFSDHNFKYITTELIKPNIQQENELIEYLDNRETYIVGTPSTPSYISTADYENSLLRTNWLDKGYGAKIADNKQRFYGYLFQSGLLEFNKYKIPISRLFAKDDNFKNITREFHNYSEELNSYLTHREGKLLLTIATREIQKVTYRNEYQIGPVKYYAFTYTYKIQPSLKELKKFINNSQQTYLGKTKLFQDPDDGGWKLVSHEVGDHDENTVFQNMNSGKLKAELNKKEKLTTDFNEAKRKEHYKSLRYYTFEFGGGLRDSSYDFEYYLGLFTPDDFIKISPITNFNGRVSITGYSMSEKGVFEYKKYKRFNSNINPGDDLNSVKNRDLLSLIDWHYDVKTRTGFHLTTTYPFNYDLKWLNSKEREIFYAENYFFGFRKSNASSVDDNKFKIEVWCSEKEKLLNLPSCDERFKENYKRPIGKKQKKGIYPQKNTVQKLQRFGDAYTFSILKLAVTENSFVVEFEIKSHKDGIFPFGKKERQKGAEDKYISHEKPYILNDLGTKIYAKESFVYGEIENKLLKDSKGKDSLRYEFYGEETASGKIKFDLFDESSQYIILIVPGIAGYLSEIKLELQLNSNTQEKEEHQSTILDVKNNNEWIVILGTFTDSKKLEKTLQKLITYNLKTTQVKITNTYASRIWMGPYSTRVEAAEVLESVSNSTGIKGFIKNYERKDQVEFASLKKQKDDLVREISLGKKLKDNYIYCDKDHPNELSLYLNFVKQTNKSKFIDTIGLFGSEFLMLSNYSLQSGLENGELMLLEKQIQVSIGDIKTRETIHQEKISGIFSFLAPKGKSEISLKLTEPTGEIIKDWSDAIRVKLKKDECTIFNLVVPEQFISKLDKVKVDHNKQKEEQKKKAEVEKKKKQAELDAKLAQEQAKSQAASLFSQYTGHIKAKVTNSWTRPGSLKPGSRAKVLVRVSPQGDVLTARIQAGSGDPIFDRSVINAVYKASPLPIPDDERLYPHYRDFVFNFDSPG